MVVPESKPFRSGKTLSTLEGDSSSEIPFKGYEGQSEKFAGSNNDAVLTSLKEMVAAGDQRLDPMLAAITDAARKLTGASGAALAMWKDGAMMCRARRGDTAPALGAQLNAETGISGECLRSGETQHCVDTENSALVDLEVCRSLGLRSIAVLPIQGWRGINGILEVFSQQPSAFNEQHIALLQQLAALAERARASQPHGASSGTRKDSSTNEKPQPTGLLPASDPVGDVALAFVGNRSRPFVLGAIGLLAISLLVLMIWLGWRGADDSGGKAHAAMPASAATSAASTLTAHPPDDDPVWKANPGGETLFTSDGKPSAGAPVKFASKVDVMEGKKVQTNHAAGRAPLLTDRAHADLANAHLANTDLNKAGDTATTPHSDVNNSVEKPSTLASSTNPSVPGATSPTKPALAALISQGVSGGQVLHRVEPVYPAQARLLRLEGTVVLSATVMEDGTVRDIKVVEGPPALAQSAVDAVKRGQYQPFELDGKPVKNQVGINVDFKIPADTATR